MLGFWGDDMTGFELMNDGTVKINGEVEPNYTATFRQIEATAPGTLQTAVNQSSGTGGIDWNALSSNLTNLIGTVVQAEAQRDLLRMNLDRARQGLPPINAQQYMPGVNVGIASDTQKMLLIGAGILAAAFVLPSLLGGGGKRRR